MLDQMTHSPSLYEHVSRLYGDYVRTVASGDLARWPDFFTEDCLYEANSRENVERGHPLPLLRCEGRKMAEDRATAIAETQVFQPRRTRYYLSNLRIVTTTDSAIITGADFLVVQAMLNSTPVVVAFGEYDDQLVWRDGRLLFRIKQCIYDNDVITTSLVYPL